MKRIADFYSSCIQKSILKMIGHMELLCCCFNTLHYFWFMVCCCFNTLHYFGSWFAVVSMILVLINWSKYIALEADNKFRSCFIIENQKPVCVFPSSLTLARVVCLAVSLWSCVLDCLFAVCVYLYMKQCVWSVISYLYLYLVGRWFLGVKAKF